MTETSQPLFLVTSIPPKLLRQDKLGREIGTEYLQACVRSWLNAGFTPVSVNSIAEPKPPVEGVRYLTVRRDARRTAGKPLVYFDDLVATAARLSDGPIVITNADILLQPPFDLHRLVADLRAGGALFGQRTDVSDWSERSGRTYANGFDFFAICGKDLSTLPRSGLIFGWPWWDYFLPMSLLLSGITLRCVQQEFAFHLIHQERFPHDAWLNMGLRYLHRQRRLLRRADGEIGLEIKSRLDTATRSARKHRSLVGHLKKFFRDPTSRKFKKCVLIATSMQILDILRARTEPSFTLGHVNTYSQMMGAGTETLAIDECTAQNCR